MAKNRGKQFEQVIKDCFEKVPGVSLDRLHDQTTGFKGSQNICDFVVYKEPYEYYIECKSVHGASLPFRNITDTQWNGLLEKSKIEGVFAGVICWWIDKGETWFLNIQYLQDLKNLGKKSIHYPDAPFYNASNLVPIKGKKKRVFFDYDMEEFLNECSEL